MSMCEEENESIMWVVDKTGLPCNWWLQENTLVECKVGCVCVCMGEQRKLDQSYIKPCGVFCQRCSVDLISVDAGF